MSDGNVVVFYHKKRGRIMRQCRACQNRSKREHMRRKRGYYERAA